MSYESELIYLAAYNGDMEMARLIREDSRLTRCSCCDDPDDPICAKCWKKCAQE